MLIAASQFVRGQNLLNELLTIDFRKSGKGWHGEKGNINIFNIRDFPVVIRD
jgi:hypothetical protein